MPVHDALKIEKLREELEEQALSSPTFVIFAAISAPFTLVGLVADANNYLAQAIPVPPGQRWVAVPLNPAPSASSEIWWAALAGANIPGLAAVLVDGPTRRLIGRKNAVSRAEVWSGSSIV